MGENTKIEWAHHTFNPWIGCTKVSPACANCYAEAMMDSRLQHVEWGPNGTRRITSDANWRKPLAWNRRAERIGIRYRVFCSSLADVFEDWDGPMLLSDGSTATDSVTGKLLTMSDVRRRLFALIDQTPHLDWLLLTKRPENIGRFWMYPDGIHSPLCFWKNIWLGTSVENQKMAHKRIPELLSCSDLSPVRFLSCEPLLERVDLDPPMCLWHGQSGLTHGVCEECAKDNTEQNVFTGWWLPGIGASDNNVNWVIAGGESGPNARVSQPEWFRSLRDQCVDSGVPFCFKQWGEWAPDEDGAMVRIGKKAAGKLLDGEEWLQIPEVTRCESGV